MKHLPALFTVEQWSQMHWGISYLRKIIPNIVYEMVGTTKELDHVCLAYEENKRPSKKQIKKLLEKHGFEITVKTSEADFLDLYKINCDVELLVCATDEEDAKQVALKFTGWAADAQLRGNSMDKESHYYKPAKVEKITNKNDVPKDWLDGNPCDLRHLFDFEGQFETTKDFLKYKEKNKKEQNHGIL